MTLVRPAQARRLRGAKDFAGTWVGLLSCALAACGPIDGTEGKPRTVDTGVVDTGVVDTGVVDTGVDDTGVDAGVPSGVPAGMVEVPAGPFLMGCNSAIDTQCNSDEGSLRTVNVARFAIDTTEVTRAAYEACVSAGGCTAPGCASAGANHPVVCIDWNQADAYCRWRGKRLPTEAEWEKAARGTDGRIWPTGNSAPTCSQANLSGCVSGGGPSTWPAGSVPGAVSPYGALDMAGNVWEWTSGWYSAAYRVNRGGGWDFVARGARASFRRGDVPSYLYGILGARCAQSL